MSDQIGEQDARRRLLAAHSSAHDPRRYRAERLPDGWVFTWGGQLTDAPLGTRPWVVLDDGRAQPVAIGSTAAQAVATLREEG